MNNSRRKELNKAAEMIRSAKIIVENAMNDEQICFDNLTEGLQQTIRGSQMEEAIDNMSTAIDECDNVIELLEETAV